MQPHGSPCMAWHCETRQQTIHCCNVLQWHSVIRWGDAAADLSSMHPTYRDKAGKSASLWNRQRKGGTKWDRFDWTYRAGSNMFHAHLQKAGNPQKDISLRVWHFLQTWTQHKNQCVWTSFQIKGEDQSRCTECWEAPQVALNQREGKSNTSKGL